MSSTCIFFCKKNLSLNNKFNQISEKMQKQKGQNNYSLVSKQSQGPLVSFQGP